MQINDMLIAEYHSNNGFTKSTFKLSDILKQLQEKSDLPKKYQTGNATWPVEHSSNQSK